MEPNRQNPCPNILERCTHIPATSYTQCTQREERPLNDEIEITVFSDEHTDAAVALWRRCGLEAPGNDSREMIARKRAFQPDLLLVATRDGELLGTVMAGY